MPAIYNDRRAELAKHFIGEKVDVIVTTFPISAAAARKARKQFQSS